MMKCIAVMVVMVAACSPSWNEPIKHPPLPGAPCGYDSVSCGNHMCCDGATACAANGECKFVGDEHEFGSKAAPTKQRSER